jgi:hypothetical protein
VLICDDVSRIARDERAALDLIDACELGNASAFSPSEDSADGIGSLRITRGGTHEEIRSFRERAPGRPRLQRRAGQQPSRRPALTKSPLPAGRLDAGRRESHQSRPG